MVKIVGPCIESHEVVVDGWQIPLLRAHPLPNGNLELVLDDRYGIEIEATHIENYVWFLAQAIAIGQGLASHPDEGRLPVRRNPLGPVRLHMISDASEEPAPPDGRLRIVGGKLCGDKAEAAE